MSLVARLKGVRYYGIPKITEIPLFCKFLLHKKLVIHVLSPIMRFSAILRYAIEGFYCTTKILLETALKVGKIVDVFFFKDVAFEKNLPVKTNSQYCWFFDVHSILTES